jgi:phospholipase/carboxylesterase
MHQKKILSAGQKIPDAKKVLIMLHGRGGSAEDILSLASYLPLDDFALLAPQATDHTWYPYSFITPVELNEPWLSSALALLKEMVEDIMQQGYVSGQIYFLGFSQGACLTLEFVARNAKKYGGVVAFTGGLIGDKINEKNYGGDFAATPVFIGSSDPDPHVPVERVYASTEILKKMNATVTEKIYPGMGHTINQDEIESAGKIFSN